VGTGVAEVIEAGPDEFSEHIRKPVLIRDLHARRVGRSAPEGATASELESCSDSCLSSFIEWKIIGGSADKRKYLLWFMLERALCD
jgi:hypothetical protein